MKKPGPLFISVPNNRNTLFTDDHHNYSDSEEETFTLKTLNPAELETLQFLEDCNRGYLAKQGIVANFKKNQFLKKGGIAVNSSTSTVNSPIKASTQDAFVMEIDYEELNKSGTEEDIATINALTGYREEVYRFRTKKIKYGNTNAMQEVLSQKLYALTGMTSPDTRLQINEDHRRLDGTPEVSNFTVLNFKKDFTKNWISEHK